MLPLVSTPVIRMRLPRSISGASYRSMSLDDWFRVRGFGIRHLDQHGPRVGSRLLDQRHRAAPPHDLDGSSQHELVALVHDPPARLDQAVLRVQLRLLRDLALHVQRVADPGRLLEHCVADAAERHHLLGIERHEAGGVREYEQPVRDALAEAAARSPLGVRVLRVGVAGEGGEPGDVRLPDRAAAGGEALAHREGVEVLFEGGHAAVSLLIRRRVLSVSRNSAAARRWPSSEGWKPSAANVARSSVAGWSEPSSRATSWRRATERQASLKRSIPSSTRARVRGRSSTKRVMSG